jgi:hypothetical protein
MPWVPPGHQCCSNRVQRLHLWHPHFCAERSNVSLSPPAKGGSRAELPFDSPPGGDVRLGL